MDPKRSATTWRCLVVLLYKGMIMRRRHYISTFFEIVGPLLLLILILSMAAYSSNERDRNQPNLTNTSLKKEVPVTKYSDPVSFRFHHTDRHTIFYAPSTEFTNNLMLRVKDIYRGGQSFHGAQMETINCSSADEVFRQFLKAQTGDILNGTTIKPTLAGIIFEGLTDPSEPPNHFAYTIRLSRFNEEMMLPFIYKNGPGPVDRTDDRYYAEFIPLQLLIDQAYLSLYSKGEFDPFAVDVSGKRFPYPPYFKYETPIGASNRYVIVFSIILGYVLMCPLIVKRIADERSSGSRELLHLMGGLSAFIYWLASFINYYLIMVIQSIVFTILLCNDYFSEPPLIAHTNSLMIFAILLLFSASALLMCFAVASLINRPVFAVIATVILWIVAFVTIFILLDSQSKSMSSSQAPAIIFSCLLPQMALHWAITLVAQYEIYGHGANLFNPVGQFTFLTIALVFLLMMLSCLMYGLLIWYFDSVIPSKYGIPKPFYFPFLRSYWFPKKEKPNQVEDPSTTPINESSTSPYFEEPPEGLTSGISLTRVRKVFGGIMSEQKVAVENVTVNIYNSQITILLGHNGAGKSTTMSMITGMYPPTKGQVLVNGYDMFSATNLARRNVGLCPQENILYNEFTVREHLKLYAMLKGSSWSQANAEVDTMVKSLNLSDKLNTIASSLSGGMKRKLCLGMALIGGSTVLILDEPSSGMDPQSRRLVWDLLQSIRAEKTILLSTHEMEEADVLGDRIAIMAKGWVKCCGSPMFLKRKFGAGYQLRIEKNIEYNSETVSEVIKTHVVGAYLVSESNSEAVYMLSEKSGGEVNAHLANLFDDLESNKSRLAIKSWGLSVTSMDDVFLKVGDVFDPSTKVVDTTKFRQKIEQRRKSSVKSNDSVLIDFKTRSGFSLTMQRLNGLLIKRFHHARRTWITTLVLITIPAMIFYLLFWTDSKIRQQTSQGMTQNVTLEINGLKLYGQTFGFFKGDDAYGSQYYSPAAKRHGINSSQISIDPNDWLLKDNLDTDVYIKSFIAGGSKLTTQTGSAYECWFNQEATFGPVISLNVLHESFQKQYSGKAESSMSVTASPIPSSESIIVFSLTPIFGQILFTVLVPIAVPFIAASYVLFPIHERNTKSKLIQLMTGLSSFLFWFANFLFDMGVHLICTLLILLIFYIMDSAGVFFSTFNVFACLSLLLILFGFAAIPFAYIISFWANKPSSGFSALCIFYLISGLILVIILTVVSYFVDVLVKKQTFDLVLSPARLLHIFTFSWGLSKLYTASSGVQTCEKMSANVLSVYCGTPGIELFRNIKRCCPDICGDECSSDFTPFTFKEDGILIELLMLFLDGIISFAIVMLFESNYTWLWYKFKDSRKSPSTQDFTVSSRIFVDSDVMDEKGTVDTLVKSGNIADEAIVVHALAKEFGGFVAVNRINLAIHKDECFGLLGINGAGKTTTFRMLTGDLMTSHGNSHIGKLNLVDNLKEYQGKVGYCPQFDALLDKLTGTEMLMLFGRLRGIDESRLRSHVEHLIEMVDLTNYKNVRTETYSGGNKRKLSLAISVIGSPPVVFLDEPTSGVDPAARRKIWATLVELQNIYHSAVVLTSHSMDECEALCSRIAIMVNGEFKCLGSYQHLRSKFGEGFTVMIKMRHDMINNGEYVNSVIDDVKKHLPTASLRGHHLNLMHFHIDDPTVTWGRLFRTLEQLKAELFLDDYLVNETNLEQIFLSFARNQRSSDNAVAI